MAGQAEFTVILMENLLRTTRVLPFALLRGVTGSGQTLTG